MEHLTDWLGIVGLVINILAMVWAAGKVANQIENLRTSFDKLEESIEKLVDRVNSNEKDISNIQGYLERNGEIIRK